MNFKYKKLRAVGSPKLRFWEIKVYLRTILVCLGLYQRHEIRQQLSLMTERISGMYDNQSKRGNLRQVFTYLKECYTVLNAALIGHKYEPKIRIATDSRGIPKIIPPKLRGWLLDDTALFTGDPRGLKNTRMQRIESPDSNAARHLDGRVPGWFDSVYHRIDLKSAKTLQRRVVFVAVQTLLSIHRTFKWWPDVDLSTITSPFNGSRHILDNHSLWNRAKVALMSLAEFKDLTNSEKFSKFLHVGPAYPFVSESAGPNTNTAHWGVVQDVIALAIRPYYLQRVLKWLLLHHSYQAIMFLVGTLFASFPFLLISSAKRRFHVFSIRYNLWYNLFMILSVIPVIGWRFTGYLMIVVSNLLNDEYYRSHYWWWRFVFERKCYTETQVLLLELLFQFLYWFGSRLSHLEVLFVTIANDLSLDKPELYLAYRDVIKFDSISGIYVEHIPLTKRFKLNRLAVVRNVSGKSRIVGITNYWIQLALRPLHKSIFRFLKGLKQDGTFDQHAPIKRLVSNRGSDVMYYSYDLTAATDRLPMDLQEYVLSLFIGKTKSSLWKEILSMPFEYDNKEYHYAVGQPMGAYSSWAMLALTHHMVVQAAANFHRGVVPFRDYAVLGDDIVITGDTLVQPSSSDDTVAKRYYEIMTSLGVEISLGKSIVSNNYIEFAKRLFDTELRDWSPVGPGLILNLVRDRNLLGLFLSELIERSLMNIHTVVELLAGTRRLTTDGVSGFCLWVMFGPRGLVHSNFHVAFLDGMKKLASKSSIPEGSLDYLAYLALCTMVNRKFFSQHYSAITCMRGFPSFVWKVARAGRGRLEACSFFLAILFSPTPGLVFSKLIEKTKWVAERPNWTGPKDMPLLIEYLREFHVEKLGSLSSRERTDLTKAYRELSRIMTDTFKSNPRPFLGSAEVGPSGVHNVFDD